MENIYQTWTHFNKIQTHLLKGREASFWLNKASESSLEWSHNPYPTGEAWKYVKFGDLPNTRLHWPNEKSETCHVADENFITIEIKNFSEPAQVKRGDWPVGLSILAEIDALDSIKSLKRGQTMNQNEFQKLGDSFIGQGLFIHFGADYKQDKPVKLILDLDHFSQKDLYIHYNLGFLVDESVEAEIFLETNGKTFCGLANVCTTSSIEKGGKLSLYQKEWGGAQSQFIFNHQSEVAGEAVLRCFDFTFPSKWSRHNVNVDLIAERAQVELYGAYFNDAQNFSDHHTYIKHSKGYTESREDYRGLLSGESQAVFNGIIYIEEKAAKSNSVQINKNLMLSESAEVDTKPELQIFNDDVKATHGATVGQLDEEQRFYLQSRGYSREKASQLLSKAFVFDLLKQEKASVLNFYSTDLELVLSQLGEN